ncbi:MAG: hypothetical protein Q9203_003691 [Teloschistes exilis]
MAVQGAHESAASPIRTLARKETYELQDMPWSPTGQPEHHDGNETRLNAAEAVLIDSPGPEDQDPISVRHLRSFTSDEEKAVVRKFDRHLVLFIALLYMLGFLDRSNVGNARIAGMSKDLSISSSQYEWMLRSFYITYVLFEWMPILYTVLTPSIYIASCVLAWGIVASLQAVATSFASLCVLRLLLGISEAAFSPGVPVYLAFFYKREELAYRIGLQISAAPLATSFASSLAWLITKLGQSSAIAPWRMLFLIEGLPSVLASVVAWFYIPNSPGEARYLSKRERRVAVLRLQEGRSNSEPGKRGRKFNWNEIWEALIDPKCYLTALMFCSCNVAFSSLPVFLPTIINDMGYSSLRSQILSAPPYLLAFLAVLLTSFYSDRLSNRSLFICFHAILAALGYASIAIAGALKAGPMWRYWGVYPVACGFFSAVTLLITWTINNQESNTKKGTGVAILNVVGQLGPFIGTALYPESDKPFYVRGMTACALFMLLVAALSLWLRRILRRKNAEIGDVFYAVIEDEDKDELHERSNVRPLDVMADRRRINPPAAPTSAPEFAVFPQAIPPNPPHRTRNPNEIRKICSDGRVVLKTGLTPSASGSAYFELEPSQPSTRPDLIHNATSSLKLTCTVHGPRPLPRSVPFSPHLLLTANVKFAPFASRHRRGYIRDVSERDLAVHVETALRGLLISERWPKSGVDVIITVLEGEDDGPPHTRQPQRKEEGGLSGWGMMSVLAGCITVASAAIADAGIDCVDLVSGGVAGIVRRPQTPGGFRSSDGAAAEIILDPCPSEHLEILAVCVVGYLSSRDEVTEIWTRGGIENVPNGEDSNRLGFEVLVDRAVDAAASSRLVLEAALKEATEAKLEKNRVVLGSSGAKRKATA